MDNKQGAAQEIGLITNLLTLCFAFECILVPFDPVRCICNMGRYPSDPSSKELAVLRFRDDRWQSR